MDGSTNAFLYDASFRSSQDNAHASAILYMEDFDCLDHQIRQSIVEDEPESGQPITQVDLERARAEGHLEGLNTALTEAGHTQSQLEIAALQSLGESLVAAHLTLERVAADHATKCVRALLSIMSACIPATMAQHGLAEGQAMLDALLPGLLCEPELRVRAHPASADTVRERLAERLPMGAIVLSVVADANLGSGDVEVAWQHGQARRDCKTIWNAIRTVMTPLGLPSIEEVCRVYGS